MPAFFIPSVDPDDLEAEYARLAQKVDSAPQAHDKRIYSISWKREGAEWTATVGEQLTSHEYVTVGKGINASLRDKRGGTNDTVTAIFPGPTFLVTHDGKSKVWNWPILTGEPTRVVYFDV
ncbi:hypothetical protein [Sphingomonas bisphenolicum]|uniref:Uncharacterized protein n=1 Tax=Sphingomonas bisphenolicum TaxID=296544 RepID=A0ABN5WCT1_9SPHN|nr:hypothetical protein [Sphingomonas bisphenolicum]BBF70103.1 hypothetical protein SBA_ch1_23030 [Sphingomonas bisphenolicum]